MSFLKSLFGGGKGDTPAGEALRARCRATLMSGGYNQEYETEGLILGYRYDG